MIALCRRFTSLDRSDRRLLLEAASSMALIWAGLRLLRFSTLRRILEHCIGSPATGNVGDADPSVIDPVRWAITAVAAQFPSATCLVQALAADAMLRRRHLASQVCLGVRVRSNNAVPIEGHAWVECDGAVAIGAIDDLSDFKVLTASRSQ